MAQQSNVGNGSTEQFDLQGFLGSLLGGTAGRFIGGRLGGPLGGTVGGWAGRVGGSFLPFSVEPGGGEAVTELELQGFMNVLRKIGSGVKTGVRVGGQVVSGAQQAAQMAEQIMRLFEAGPAAPQAQPQEPVTELELQGFMNVLRKIGSGVKTTVRAGTQVASGTQQAAQIAQQLLGLFEAGPAPAQAQEPPTELELQAFWAVLQKLGQVKLA